MFRAPYLLIHEIAVLLFVLDLESEMCLYFMLFYVRNGFGSQPALIGLLLATDCISVDLGTASKRAIVCWKVRSMHRSYFI
jgi:hypothetical protein